MNINKYTNKSALLLLVLLLGFSSSFAQASKLSAPQEEKLLNGLKLLVWNEPNAEKVTVKLRFHNGSAFDPQNKEGTMALLADALFPNEAQREFFREDLGGSLEVISNYDYIQINATANPDQFSTLLETLANAVTNPQIDKETTARIRAARLEKIKEIEKNPAYIADRAAAKRLFGDFPYGRAQMGTSESVPKIDYADLLLAKQKFFTPDNATIAVIGNVKPDFALRAARRFFGSWVKSDKKVPAIFRQPITPENKELIIEIPNAEKSVSRQAMMTVARNDKDFYATQILTRIWQKQFCYNIDSKTGKSKLETHLLRGIYVVSIDLVENELPMTARDPCLLMLQKDGKEIYPPITQNDFDTGKFQVTAEYQQKAQSILELAEMWLDVDTFKLNSVKDEMTKLNGVTIADVQRVAESLQNQPEAKVRVNKSGVAKQ